MKKILSLLLAMILVLGLCACGASEQTQDTGEGAVASESTNAVTNESENDATTEYAGLQVGFGRENIIPDIVGVEIAGGDASARLSDGVIDEVAATCIAIKEGDQTILLYTIDLITVDKQTYQAQSRISEATGIPEENIILNCTHTHNGVSIRSNWPGVDAYRNKVYESCALAGKQALDDLAPAELYYGSAMTENMVFVRHYLMNDGTTYGNGHGSAKSGYKDHAYPSDGELQVIKFAREDKKDVILTNLGAHATINSGSERGKSKSVSADWPYNVRTYVEENSDSLCAVFEAAAGDQIPNSAISGLAPYGNKYPEFGNKIGEYCLEVINGEMKKAEGSGINLKVHNYTAKSMKEGLDDAELLSKASEVNALAGQYGSSALETKAAVEKHGFSSVYEATGLMDRSGYPETYSMELHLMTVDGVSFIFAPFEMFGVTGRAIKDTSPYDMTFVITCSENRGGHMGYLPHEYGCEQGFYEYDVTKFARGTAEDLAITYVELLTEMKNAG